MSEIGELISGDAQSFPIWSGSVSGASDRTTLSNSSWSQIWTTIHDNAPSGANLSVSGSGDIKGGDDTYRLPHTQALTVSPIKIENRTNSEILYINFEIEDTEDGTEAFEPRMTAILQIDNDGEGLQTGDPTGARQINFEFVLWAMPEIFISLGGNDPVEMVRTFKVSCPPKAGTTV
ncbi:hypothetical protein BFJ72_g3927 [Fusarium proliferatum]|nr:hypothetical protein BFJ72_g3927 [Fusarium proliferatum]